ncbi:hypothetical protein GCM10023319_39300 [Nocardia iowensis]
MPYRRATAPTPAPPANASTGAPATGTITPNNVAAVANPATNNKPGPKRPRNLTPKRSRPTPARGSRRNSNTP